MSYADFHVAYGACSLGREAKILKEGQMPCEDKRWQGENGPSSTMRKMVLKIGDECLRDLFGFVGGKKEKSSTFSDPLAV